MCNHIAFDSYWQMQNVSFRMSRTQIIKVTKGICYLWRSPPETQFFKNLAICGNSKSGTPIKEPIIKAFDESQVGDFSIADIQITDTEFSEFVSSMDFRNRNENGQKRKSDSYPKLFLWRNYFSDQKRITEKFQFWSEIIPRWNSAIGTKKRTILGRKIIFNLTN